MIQGMGFSINCLRFFKVKCVEHNYYVKTGGCYAMLLISSRNLVSTEIRIYMLLMRVFSYYFDMVLAVTNRLIKFPHPALGHYDTQSNALDVTFEKDFVNCVKNCIQLYTYCKG